MKKRNHLDKLRLLAKFMLVASIAACLIGIWLVIAGVDELADLEALGEATREHTAPVITEMAEGMVLAVHYFFVSKFFIDSLKEGVPFTRVGAKELRVLGYETILLPILAWIVSIIAYAGIESPLMIMEISIYEMVLGFAIIIMSYVLDEGAYKIHQGRRGHAEMDYIAEHYPNIVKETRLALFGSENKDDETKTPFDEHHKIKKQKWY